MTDSKPTVTKEHNDAAFELILAVRANGVLLLADDVQHIFAEALAAAESRSATAAAGRETDWELLSGAWTSGWHCGSGGEELNDNPYRCSSCGCGKPPTKTYCGRCDDLEDPRVVGYPPPTGEDS